MDTPFLKNHQNAEAFRTGRLSANDLKEMNWDPGNAIFQLWFNDQPYGFSKKIVEDTLELSLLPESALGSIASGGRFEFTFKPAHAKVRQKIPDTMHF